MENESVKVILFIFISLGNHEFDDGVSGLTPFIRNLSCPVLAANLILTKEPDLEAEHNLMKSVVFNINGTKVGIIGYLTPDTKTLALENNVDYVEEVKAIREELKKLKSEGVKIFIALGHSGFLKDLEIAKEVEDIALVIGGHTNTFLWNGTVPDSEVPQGPYPTLVKQKSGRLVPVVQAYAYTKYLGKLHLIFNSKGELVKFDGNPILLDSSVPQDPNILTIVKRYREDIAEISEAIVAEGSVHLDGLSCRLKECNLGNLICDAMVSKYALEYRGEGWTDAPVAVMQGGAIRASINHVDLRFNITKGDLYTVMPFGGTLCKLTLNGSTLKKMLEHAVAKYNVIRAPGQFLQVSGLKVEYDFKKKPGSRVTKVQVLCGRCRIPTYEMLNYTKVYNILTNGFLAKGGDGFEVFNGSNKINLYYNEFESTVEYMNRTKLVYPAVEGRVIIHNIDSVSKSTSTTISIVVAFFAVACNRIL